MTHVGSPATLRASARSANCRPASLASPRLGSQAVFASDDFASEIELWVLAVLVQAELVHHEGNLGGLVFELFQCAEH